MDAETLRDAFEVEFRVEVNPFLVDQAGKAVHQSDVGGIGFCGRDYDGSLLRPFTATSGQLPVGLVFLTIKNRYDEQADQDNALLVISGVSYDKEQI